MKRIIFIFIFLCSAKMCFSQRNADSLELKNQTDSVFKNQTDSVLIDNSGILDTSKQVKSDIDAPINYEAKDSLVYDLKNNKVFLYNDAMLTYKDLKLEAGRITVDQETQILEAYGVPDSVREGKFVQNPLLFQGKD